MFGVKNPDVEPFMAVASGEWLEGEVIDMSNFAVYVKLAMHGGGEEVVKGMIHKSQFKAGFADHATYGDTVRVRVTAVDTAKRHVSLSMLPS